jgi:adenine-specific DNA-methyltransferase
LSAIPPVTAVDPEAQSANPVAANLEVLKALFPDAFTEGRIDFDVLRQLLGDAIDDGDEKYGLNWSGKRRARRLALTPSLGTLLPAPQESVDWATTRNLMIEGDNLEVLKLLQKSYAGKVNLIYIDPPYNTGNDFVYPDDYADSLGNYLRRTRQVDEGGVRTTSNAETSGRFHTEWLNMMYPRLFLARSMLRPDGVLFVNIGDTESDNARKLCSEIFGEENFVAHICWQKKYAVSQDDPGIGSMHDNILVFSKSAEFRRRLLPREDKQLSRYRNIDQDPRGPWAADNYIGNNSKDERPTLWYPIKHPITGEDVWPKESAVWRYSKEKHQQIEAEGRLYWGPNNNYERPRIKKFLNEIQDGVVPSTWWPFSEVGHNDEAQKETAALLAPKVFTTPKPIRLLRRIIEISGSAESVVMDFFAGSGSTAHAVMEQNALDGGSRRFIAVQIPEPLSPNDKDQRIAADFCDSIDKPRNIAELTKERLRRAGAKIKADAPDSSADLGFRVYKLAISNLKAWGPGEDLAADLLSAADNLAPGRTEEDLLVELLLKQGIDLTEPAMSRIIADRTVHSFGGGVLMACLGGVAAAGAETLANGMAQWVLDLKPVAPTTIFFKDAGFQNDQAKTNVDAILRQRLDDQLLKVRSV